MYQLYLTKVYVQNIHGEKTVSLKLLR